MRSNYFEYVHVVHPVCSTNGQEFSTFSRISRLLPKTMDNLAALNILNVSLLRFLMEAEQEYNMLEPWSLTVGEEHGAWTPDWGICYSAPIM